MKLQHATLLISSPRANTAALQCATDRWHQSGSPQTPKALIKQEPALRLSCQSTSPQRRNSVNWTHRPIKPAVCRATGQSRLRYPGLSMHFAPGTSPPSRMSTCPSNQHQTTLCPMTSRCISEPSYEHDSSARSSGSDH